MVNRPWLALLTLIMTAMPCSAQITDDAGLFRAETLSQAETRIQQIREQTGKQVAVWTIKELPKERAAKINLDDAGQRKELFEELVREHIKKLDLQGVHLLVCQDPPHIGITVTEDTEALFGKWYREHLKGRMIGKFQPDNPDQHLFKALRNKLRSGPNPNAGLLEALDYVGTKLDYNRPIDQTNLYLGLVIMAGMIGAWVFLGMVRARLRKRGPASAGVHDADDSGRSIAVLGGGIGAVSGQWLVNRLFGRRVPDEPPRLAVEDLPPPPLEEPHG
jgi:hypothetical protein